MELELALHGATATPGPSTAVGAGRPAKVDGDEWLGYDGAIFVLFETPSAFAIFLYSGVKLYLPDAIESIWADFILVSRAGIIWLKDFRILKDKASATTDTGVSDEFSRMIKKWLLPGQRLAVGKAEYKTIIEARLVRSVLTV
ncbi:hypothetical protein ACP4OV_013798 [Aristida adscensionis]